MRRTERRGSTDTPIRTRIIYRDSLFCLFLGEDLLHMENRITEVVSYHYNTSSEPKYSLGIVVNGRNQIRGQLIKNNQDELTENTRFEGPHYVECYIIKDGICVASDKINVPIGNNSV